MRHPQSHDSHIAGTRDLHQIRLKWPYRVKDEILIPAEQRITVEIMVQAERCKSPLELERGHILTVSQLSTGATVGAKTSRPAVCGMSHKLAADRSHSVRFCKRIGEERDAQCGCQRAAPGSRMEDER